MERKQRNQYRNLVIEFYARNSSSVLAITHKRWPAGEWTSQPQLARLLSKDGLPMACYVPEEEKTITPNRPPFNPAYVADGKIDKPKLFNAVLGDKNLTWTELKESIMEAATICSGRFAETLISEARDTGLITSIPCDDGKRRYTIIRETLFDETS